MADEEPLDLSVKKKTKRQRKHVCSTPNCSLHNPSREIQFDENTTTAPQLSQLHSTLVSPSQQTNVGPLLRPDFEYLVAPRTGRNTLTGLTITGNCSVVKENGLWKLEAFEYGKIYFPKLIPIANAEIFLTKMIPLDQFLSTHYADPRILCADGNQKRDFYRGFSEVMKTSKIPAIKMRTVPENKNLKLPPFLDIMISYDGRGYHRGIIYFEKKEICLLNAFKMTMHVNMAVLQNEIVSGPFRCLMTEADKFIQKQENTPFSSHPNTIFGNVF